MLEAQKGLHRKPLLFLSPPPLFGVSPGGAQRSPQAGENSPLPLANSLPPLTLNFFAAMVAAISSGGPNLGSLGSEAFDSESPMPQLVSHKVRRFVVTTTIVIMNTFL
eukprot:1187786-Prorocentrum_minimum.AAC.1